MLIVIHIFVIIFYSYGCRSTKMRISFKYIQFNLIASTMFFFLLTYSITSSRFIPFNCHNVYIMPNIRFEIHHNLFDKMERLKVKRKGYVA